MFLVVLSVGARSISFCTFITHIHNAGIIATTFNFKALLEF